MSRLTSIGLARSVRRFRLNLHGMAVWCPYWINQDNQPFYQDAPLRGKGEWVQIARATRAAARAENVEPQSSDEWRLLMRQHGLGIDCSGFVYRVMTDWLHVEYGVVFADGLYVSAQEIHDRHRRLPALAQQWRKGGGPLDIPAQLPLAVACRLWNIDAAAICNVRRLVDSRAVDEVLAAGELLPGDLIVTSRGGTDHIGVVVRVSAKRITYVDSADDHRMGGLGGVAWRSIELVHPQLGLEAQAWEGNQRYHRGEPGRRDGMWRLRIVAEACGG